MTNPKKKGNACSMRQKAHKNSNNVLKTGKKSKKEEITRDLIVILHIKNQHFHLG